MSGDSILSDVAAGILKRAVELDNNKRYTEAVICYGEGIQVLINLAKGISDVASKSKLHEKIETYISRAEKLKLHVETEKETGSYHEKILIENNSTGNSYKSVFGRFLDDKVYWVVIEDPYIKTYYQREKGEREKIVLSLRTFAVRVFQNAFQAFHEDI